MTTRTSTYFGASKVLALSVLAGCTGEIGAGGPRENAPRITADPAHPSSVVGARAGDATSVDLEQDLHCGAPKVGSAPLRRLTSDEYIDTVRDLLGVEVSPDTLPADEQIGPFHGNAASPITDLYTQQYIDNAETLAAAAMSNIAKLVPCDPVKAGNADCASRFIDSFGQKTSRRPLTDDEKKRYLVLYNTYSASQGFANGIRLVITAMLQAPHFLYHVEFESPKNGPLAPLGGYEMASRLAYFLWSSMPDDTLFIEASQNALSDPVALRVEADRMLKDPRAESTIRNFHLAWLGLDDFDSLEKDTQVYPTFTPALRDAMKAETAAFASDVILRGDAKLGTLLTAPYSILSGPLFDFYGVAMPAGATAKQKVQLDPTQRAGILTQGGFLAAHAHSNQSAPVLRGVTVIRNVLCQELPDPPADSNPIAPDPSPTATTRERFAAHEKVATCGACHKTIDQLGFGFESYDGIGKFRTTDQGRPVDAQGSVIGTKSVDGPFNGAVELAKRLAGSVEARQCSVRQWMRFAIGRLETEDDLCSLQALVKVSADSQDDIRAVLSNLVTTDAFRMRRLDP